MSLITRATTDDIPALLPLVNSAYRGEASRKGWTTEAGFLEGDLRTDAQDLAQLLGRPDAVILKYESGEAGIAGCVFLEVRQGRLYLGMLSVDPERQAQGIGKKLLNAAEEHARQVGCRSVYMRVLSKRSEIIAWYERHGYALTGERMPYDAPPKFGIPTEPLEFVIMEKMIAST